MNTLLAAIPLFFWDFSVSDQGFVSSGDIGQWSWGVCSTGPASPDAVWGTNLTGNYLNDATEYLELPPLDLTGTTQPVLVFRHWHGIRAGDFGLVEVDDGGGFVRVEPIYDYPDPSGFTGQSDWRDTSVDLTGFGNTPRVRFAFTADASVSDDGWYLSNAALFDGDATPPVVSALVLPFDTQELVAGYPISLLALDDVAVTAVDLYVSIDSGPATFIAFTNTGGGKWDAEIPAQSPDTDVTWYAVATDGTQTTRFPGVVDEAFRVFLAAPENFRGPDSNRLVGNEVTLSWDGPVSPHSVVSYQVDDTVNSQDVTGLEATVSVDADSPLAWTVTAVYDAGPGDPSELLELDVEVPELDPMSPPGAFQGDVVRVQIRGASLYMFQDDTEFDVGADIEVSELWVHDVNTASAILTISEDAEVGPRAARITGTEGGFTFADAFVVLDGAAAPRIVEVSPMFGIQGDDLTVRVTASQDFSGPVVVEAGEDMVVTDAILKDDFVRVKLVINNSARIGTHTLVLDDGVRLWTADFEVRERIYTGSTGCQGCATTGEPGPMWLLLLLLFGVRRPS